MNNSYSRFKKLLEEKGITAYNVAKNTGIATATLSDWKNGKSTPKQDKMNVIANYLDVSLEYLMTGTESTYNIYSKENAFLLAQIARMCNDKTFGEHLKKYISLTKTSRKTIDDMIDFIYYQKQKGED